MDKVFTECVHVFRRGILKGSQCEEPVDDGEGFCWMHSLIEFESMGYNKSYRILCEAIKLNDLHLINKCLQHCHLTQDDIDTAMMSCFNLVNISIPINILLSPKYFPELRNYRFIIDNENKWRTEGNMRYWILYKRFLISTLCEKFLGSNDLLPRLLCAYNNL